MNKMTENNQKSPRTLCNLACTPIKTLEKQGWVFNIIEQGFCTGEYKQVPLREQDYVLDGLIDKPFTGFGGF